MKSLNRQFLTRKQARNTLQPNFDSQLGNYFNQNIFESEGIPNITYFAEKLNISKNYLSDMLRSTTGKSTQQYIQHKMIKNAKELLTFSKFNVSDIAYQLGFEYPQYCHKLFKTEMSPLEYRTDFKK